MFDILKYQLQQESEAKAKKDKLDPMFSFASSTSSPKQTYSITSKKISDKSPNLEIR